MKRPKPIIESALIDGFCAMQHTEISWENQKFRHVSEELLDAIKHGEWDAIAKSATYMHNLKNNPAEALKSCAIGFAAFLHETLESVGGPRPTKGDILDLIEAKAPSLFKTIPTSPTALREWWKLVDCDIQQSRGYIRPEIKELISEFKKDQIS
jgi:hypothetical protein